MSLRGVACRGKSPMLTEVFQEGEFIPFLLLRAEAAPGRPSWTREAEWSTQGSEDGTGTASSRLGRHPQAPLCTACRRQHDGTAKFTCDKCLL